MDSEFRLIIAGTRTFNNYKLLEEKVLKYFSLIDTKNIIIVSGGAKGADKLGEEFAAKHAIPVEKYLADWDKHGKKAGILRNEDMALVSDGLLLFWDGKSRGSNDMRQRAKARGLLIRIVYYED